MSDPLPESRHPKHNDTSFKPGASGNPGGRPKGPSITAAIMRNLTEEDADAIAKAWIRDAKRGKFRENSRQTLTDRTDGKVPTQIGGVIGDDGAEKPIPIKLLGP